MDSGDRDVVFAGDIGLTIPLIGSGVMTLVSAIYAPSMLATVISVALGLWLLLLAHYFPVAGLFWHYATLGTFVYLGVNTALLMTFSAESFFTYIWLAWCSGAVLYLALTARRKKRLHEI